MGASSPASYASAAAVCWRAQCLQVVTVTPSRYNARMRSDSRLPSVSVAAALLAGGMLCSSACILDRAGLKPDPTSHAGGGGLVGAGGVGAGGSAGSTTTSTGTGGTGGAGPVEQNCLNGVDDDGDTLTDCDDPDCAAFSCVPSVATATAYVALLGRGELCDAPGVSETVKWCEGCSCNEYAGTCSFTAEVHNDPGCNSYITTENSPVCRDTQGVSRWIEATTNPNNDASCTPASAEVPATAASACSLAQAGRCSGGEACVPASLATSQQSCVLLPGRVECEAPYTERRIVYQGASDQCTCSCPAAALQGCAATSIVVSASTNDCGTQDNLVAMDGVCHATGPMESVRYPAVAGTISCGVVTQLSDSSPANTLCCVP